VRNGFETFAQRINFNDHQRDGDFFLRERVKRGWEKTAARADDGDLVDDDGSEGE
jgi:hypothetical protein